MLSPSWTKYPHIDSLFELPREKYGYWPLGQTGLCRALYQAMSCLASGIGGQAIQRTAGIQRSPTKTASFFVMFLYCTLPLSYTRLYLPSIDSRRVNCLWELEDFLFASLFSCLAFSSFRSTSAYSDGWSLFR